MQFLELFRVDLTGRFGHQIAGLLRFWECDHFANVIQPGKQHHPTIDSQCDSTVRRSAILERVEQETEPIPCGLFVDAQQFKDLLLGFTIVDPDRSPARLAAVDDQVVSLCPTGCRGR